jgi:lauroyl/myristoyl acyltransferase
MRRPEGGHVAEIKPLLWPDPELKGEEALLELTQRCTAHLESYVRAFPDHYFWAHRRWKTRPGTRKDESPAVAVNRDGGG